MVEAGLNLQGSTEDNGSKYREFAQLRRPIAIYSFGSNFTRYITPMQGC